MKAATDVAVEARGDRTDHGRLVCNIDYTSRPVRLSTMSPRTVLVAEDDTQVREALVRALRFEGYVAVGVNDGAGALEAVDERTPDVIVLDVSMPLVDGLSVCRRMRARRPDPDPDVDRSRRSQRSGRRAGRWC